MIFLTVYDDIKSLFGDGLLDFGFIKMATYFQGVALGIAIFLYLINMGINMVHTGTELKGQIFNFKELIKTAIPIFMIMIFPLLFGPVAFVIDSINTVTALSEDDIEQINNHMGKLAESQYEYSYFMDSTLAVNSPGKDPAKNGTTENLGTSIGQSYGSLFTAAPMAVITYIVGVFLTIIRVVISMIGIYLFKILYVLGPFAFAFSIIPTFRNSADTWFASWIGMGIIHNTYNVLESVMIVTVVKENALIGIGVSNVLASLALSFTMIGCYVSVFWLTSKYLSGSGDNGKVMSNLMTAIQTSAQVKAAGFSGGGSSGLSVADNVIKTGSSGINSSGNGKKSGIEAN